MNINDILLFNQFTNLKNFFKNQKVISLLKINTLFMRSNKLEKIFPFINIIT